MRSMVPRKFTPAQHVEFYTAYRMRQLNNALARYFKKIDVMDNILPAVTFYNTKRAEILARGTPDLKEEYARLERQPQQSENQENEPPSELTRRIEAPTAAQQGIFSSFSPQPAKTTQPLLNGNATSTPANPFQLSNPQSSLTPSPAPSKGKRKGEDLTKDDYEASSSSSPLKRAKMQQANGTNSGSATSNLFKEALNSPAKPSPSRRSPEKSMPKNPVDDKPRTNPFGNLPVPGKSAVGNSAATPSSGNIFGNASPATTTLFQPSPAKPAATSVFAAPAPSEQKQAPIKPPTFGIQPPKFGAGATSNFMEQFSKKAVDTEEERMREAMEDEYDSDDSDAEPREEWIAKWKKKRAAELKEIKEKGGKGFVFGGDKPQASSEPEKSGNKLSEGKSLFGQPVSSQNSGSSVFSSLNGSRTSTPGPFSSRAGSVLDNHTSGQLPSSGGNIFGHLSDADSGGDSGKGDDADEESANEDTESDTENKDPSYKPGEESKSGPGTPASETGAGIASAKKASNPFTFGSSRSVPSVGPNSGTSTPGGSIFDRITKDANGNPVREISSEEKENTQPSSGTKFTGSNLFAGLNDKTWNPDSPIKFGSTTPNNDSKSAPTVNVQAATPTKPSSPFGNLFGNSTAATNGTASSPAPFSNLFGSSSTPKPTTPAGVGFNFGTTSTSSSLFPSAAVSASTSRATTPGATTDGDSGVEGDPDAEQHEQIDLTAGGPGEEDEEVLHEVRSKALKFVTKSEGDKGQWETKGLGPLRVLKHKDTKAVRILLRADPSGTIVLNKALLSGAKYEPSGKTIKLMTAADTGKGLETWILQVKTPELADSLSKILESNKPSSS
ncbi:hypothetical protein B0J14DRAFT_466974 [Halenospora varia]|nr:hypothetical protein B0J14DRAFT_466974 [Halenospora varia]